MPPSAYCPGALGCSGQLDALWTNPELQPQVTTVFESLSCPQGQPGRRVDPGPPCRCARPPHPGVRWWSWCPAPDLVDSPVSGLCAHPLQPGSRVAPPALPGAWVTFLAKPLACRTLSPRAEPVSSVVAVTPPVATAGPVSLPRSAVWGAGATSRLFKGHSKHFWLPWDCARATRKT